AKLMTSALSRLRIGIGRRRNICEAAGHGGGPMQKKDMVRLTGEERWELQEVSRKLKGSSQKGRRAQLWLKADAEGPAWSDSRLAAACAWRRQPVEMLRQ